MPKSTAIKAGYAPDLSCVDFDLRTQARKLLALFIADKEIKKMLSRQDLRHLEYSWDSDSDSDILSLLVELATKYRMMVWNVSEKEKSKHHADDVIGVIKEENKAEFDLRMRSACDKIIHAEKIVFDVTKLRGTDYHYRNPLIHINGKRGKVRWEVVIDIVSFCNTASRPATRDFEELTSGCRSE